MEIVEKEVFFDEYCNKCKFWDKQESEDPCHECLNNFTNTYSHKPVMFKPKDE